jgi:hypothetical protein
VGNVAVPNPKESLTNFANKSTGSVSNMLFSHLQNRICPTYMFKLFLTCLPISIKIYDHNTFEKVLFDQFEKKNHASAIKSKRQFFLQEVLGRLSEDSDEGGGSQEPVASTYPTSHTFPWQQPPRSYEAGQRSEATEEDEERPLELVKRKQEPQPQEGGCK